MHIPEWIFWVLIIGSVALIAHYFYELGQADSGRTVARLNSYEARIAKLETGQKETGFWQFVIAGAQIFSTFGRCVGCG